MLREKNNNNNAKFLLKLCLLLSVILAPFFIFQKDLYVITSPSMSPTLNVGDLVISGEKSGEEIKVGNKDGDILILKGPEYFYEQGFDPIFWNYLENDTPIIHRAIDKKEIDDSWYFLTKGDNNLVPDGSFVILNKTDEYILIEYNNSNVIYISETEILGIVVFKIPFIGYFKIFSTLIIVFTIGILVFYLLLKKLKVGIKIVKKKEEY